ncbi:hypothetical protein EYC98_03330 [Halieaceae bacterium IMCC14734]|uniref:DUF4468 domain-containing protein n=1 Tax=Candidatus Litorirhabdus singularis TaxID=2518993 RepID=A0ABT3TDN3_9GAMM|nr:hypothetical protein [Candidatus Litorirhabdus singularis]MCX2979891.1 hypothetical protein [Candidatus Litorirhabdus singularis]
MRKFGALIALFIFVVAQANAQDSESESVSLPSEYDWQLVTHQYDAENYLKEWVREGEDIESAKWLLVKQKLELPKKQSSKKYIKSIFRIARSACTDVLYNGPEKFPLDSGGNAYVGRVMCAQIVGKPYGAFTDMSVLVEGKTAYIFTSEIRMPSSPKAGILSFDPGSDAEIEMFMQQISTSAGLVRMNAGLLAE